MMTDDDQIIEKMAKAMCLSMETDSNPPCEGVCYICKKQARAALAVARPIIREQALEDAANMVETHIEFFRGGVSAGVVRKTAAHEGSTNGNAFAKAIRSLKDKTDD